MGETVPPTHNPKMFTFTPFFFILATSIASCYGEQPELATLKPDNSSSKLQPRIVGGAYGDITTFPYQVSVQYNGYHICGGSLLNNYIVITSARCLLNLNLNWMSMRAGSTWKETGGQVRPLNAYAVHPYFNPMNADYDYALLQVYYPFIYTSGVQPIRMYSYTPYAYATLVITGWGQTQDIPGSALSPYLQYTNLYVFDWNVCTQRYGYTVTSRQICGMYPGRDMCTGDIGGPAAVILSGERLLAGITSYSRGCANTYYPSIYSNIAQAKSWLNYYGLNNFV